MSIRTRLTSVVNACAFVVLVTYALIPAGTRLPIGTTAAVLLWLAALLVAQLAAQALATSIESQQNTPGVSPLTPSRRQRPAAHPAPVAAAGDAAAPAQRSPKVSGAALAA
ncbi:MAG: hypothetical protein WCO11_08270 [Sphingomonadales bacterium]